MLTGLNIRDVVLIEALDLDFRAGLGVLTGDQMMVEVLVRLGVALAVHRHEREHLHETRIHMTAAARIGPRHFRDHILAEPFERS